MHFYAHRVIILFFMPWFALFLSWINAFKIIWGLGCEKFKIGNFLLSWIEHEVACFVLIVFGDVGTCSFYVLTYSIHVIDRWRAFRFSKNSNLGILSMWLVSMIWSCFSLVLCPYTIFFISHWSLDSSTCLFSSYVYEICRLCVLFLIWACDIFLVCFGDCRVLLVLACAMGVGNVNFLMKFDVPLFYKHSCWIVCM